MTLREFVESASAKIEIIFRETGKVSAMYHFIANGESVTIPAPPLPKNAAFAFMRDIFAKLGVTRFVFIDEAWLVSLTASREDIKSYADAAKRFKNMPTPREHPDRKEVVMFYAEDENEGFFSARRPIERDANGKSKLGPLDTEQPTVSGGRMTGLLPTKGKMQ
jgi:mRNA degradation ribonuclease J1/J2